MGVYSIGVDVAEIPRIQQMIERYSRKFLERVFTDHEIRYCGDKINNAQNYAARFAAKEAVFKAAGTGLSLGMSWKDVEVANDDQGKPFLRLSGKTAEFFKGKSVHLSLTHTNDIAIAMVVVDQPFNKI